MTPAEIANLITLALINVCGYVALGDRLKKVEQKIDRKVEVADHEHTKSRVKALEDAA